ncbi:hypothetical protein [Actinomadura chibensis]|uniref:Uncharacterized protein n=1 Tax=Actinomadura chibensis TaxID=392828 RepID=A0A5D0NQ86_9ACTN|nr:hypothetical protein [Actinomadura chibensis]TYB46364.1 hypothetical protein FXF69_13945 [Actinomadura chibensis]
MSSERRDTADDSEPARAGGEGPSAVFTSVLIAVAGVYGTTRSIPVTVISGIFALLITLLVLERRR